MMIQTTECQIPMFAEEVSSNPVTCFKVYPIWLLKGKDNQLKIFNTSGIEASYLWAWLLYQQHKVQLNLTSEFKSVLVSLGQIL